MAYRATVTVFRRLEGVGGTTRVRCSILSDALPRLREVFGKKTNEEGVFPLFPPKLQEHVWNTVPINDSRQAAILAPLVCCDGVPSLLYTTRSDNMPTHSSEVSFPGGHFDKGTDESLEDAAIREAQEELLGEYPWDEVEILGRGSPVPSINGTPVTPIMCVMPYEISKDTFTGNPGEVDSVFCVDLQTLMDIETTMPSDRFQSKIPLYPAGEGRKIWGLTAVVTRPCLHKLFKPVFLRQTSNT